MTVFQSDTYELSIAGHDLDVQRSVLQTLDGGQWLKA